MAKTNRKNRIKNYVLDTNVLIHDPESLLNFQENNVFIPVEVLEELDKIKTEHGTERGATARRAHRILDKIFENDPKKLREGVILENKGRIRILVQSNEAKYKEAKDTIARHLGNAAKPDHCIIAAALFVEKTFPPPTILVSKDINVRLKALALGLAAEDYLTDKKGGSKEKAIPTLILQDNQQDELDKDGETELYPEQGTTLMANDYTTCARSGAPLRCIGNRRIAIVRGGPIHIPGGIDITPRSPEQASFLDALFDPRITLVTCEGMAGSGKTILALAAALNQTIAQHRYDAITISKPIVSMGKDLGFLPGNIEEKMKPWLQPYHDALDVLIPKRGGDRPEEPRIQMPSPSEIQSMHKSKRKQLEKQLERQKQAIETAKNQDGTPVKPWQWVMTKGFLEIEALCFIRGRSIPRHFFILDEAQQLTPHEIKTVITRMGEGSKIVLLGDTAQIDNPYVDSLSNGLVYARTKLRGQSFAAHLRLIKGERSPLAEAGALLL